jgi:hypothetical protein
LWIPCPSDALSLSVGTGYGPYVTVRVRRESSCGSDESVDQQAPLAERVLLSSQNQKGDPSSNASPVFDAATVGADIALNDPCLTADPSHKVVPSDDALDEAWDVDVEQEEQTLASTDDLASGAEAVGDANGSINGEGRAPSPQGHGTAVQVTAEPDPCSIAAELDTSKGTPIGDIAGQATCEVVESEEAQGDLDDCREMEGAPMGSTDCGLTNDDVPLRDAEVLPLASSVPGVFDCATELCIEDPPCAKLASAAGKNTMDGTCVHEPGPSCISDMDEDVSVDVIGDHGPQLDPIPQRECSAPRNSPGVVVGSDSAAGPVAHSGLTCNEATFHDTTNDAKEASCGAIAQEPESKAGSEGAHSSDGAKRLSGTGATIPRSSAGTPVRVQGMDVDEPMHESTLLDEPRQHKYSQAAQLQDIGEAVSKPWVLEGADANQVVWARVKGFPSWPVRPCFFHKLGI